MIPSVMIQNLDKLNSNSSRCVRKTNIKPLSVLPKQQVLHKKESLLSRAREIFFEMFPKLDPDYKKFVKTV